MMPVNEIDRLYELSTKIISRDLFNVMVLVLEILKTRPYLDDHDYIDIAYHLETPFPEVKQMVADMIQKGIFTEINP